MGKFFYKNNNYRQGGKVRYNDGGITGPLSTYAGANAGAGINFQPRVNLGYLSNQGDDASDLVKAGNFQLGANLGINSRANTAGVTSSYTQPFATEGPLKNLSFRGSSDIGMTQLNKGNVHGAYGNFSTGLGYNKVGEWQGENYKYGRGINATLGANMGGTGHRAGQGVYGELQGHYGPLNVFGGRGSQGNYGGIGVSFPFKKGGKVYNNGGVMGEDPSNVVENLITPENESVQPAYDNSTTAADVYGVVPQVEMADEALNTASSVVNVLSEEDLLDKVKADKIAKNAKFQKAAGEATKGITTAGTALELGKTAFGPGDAEGEISGGKMALSGAMKGASAGAAYGPWGALIGAGVGAVAGQAGAAKNRQARITQSSEASSLTNLGDVRDHLSSNISQQKSEQYIQELIAEQLKNPEQKQNVVSGLQSNPKSSLLGEYGMKLQKSFKSGGIMGDKNPHVSDDNYNAYYSQLQMGENAGSKGYDKATGLWYPFSVGINDERNIGWGINMSTFSQAEQDRLSKGITQKEVEKLYSDRIAHHLDKSQKYINSWDGSWSRTDKNTGETLSGNTGYKGSEGNWAKLPDNVKLALTDFSYNLGGLQKFPKFVTAVMNNDLNGAMAEYKRYYTDNGVRKESTKRNEEIHNMLFKNAKGNGKIYKKGGMTPGENNHDSNPLTVVDSNGQNTGMELTGGEGVYDAASQKKIESLIKKKKYAQAGKVIEYEINDWKQRGMYS